MRKKILIIISVFVFIAMLVMNLTMAKSDNNTILLVSLQKLALANGEQDCTFTYYFTGQMQW